MTNRINIKRLEPGAYLAMDAMEKYLAATQITPAYKHLIKIRASQINGCVYCINLHTNEAREAGETEQRMHGLVAWHEAPYYNDDERAILALTEEVTLISEGGVSDEVYEEVLQRFGEHVTAQLIMAIISINSWNRIAISTLMVPNEWRNHPAKS